MRSAATGAAWAWQTGGHQVHDLVAGAWGSTRVRRLADYFHDFSYGAEAYFSGFAYGGDAVYWRWRHEYTSDSCVDDPAATCRMWLDAGGVKRWSGGAVTSIPGAPAVFAIAAEAQRIVVVGADVTPRSEKPRPPEPKIVVLRGNDGASLASFPWGRGSEAATAMAIGLGGSTVVLLPWRGPLELRHLPEGRLLHRIRLPTRFWRGFDIWRRPAVSVSGEHVVVTNDSDTIYVVGLKSARVTSVVRNGVSIVGAGISEGRLYWGENRMSGEAGFRIRSMPLPG